tara:strand:- start:902 stop:1033 length:132 start_codon:yes stop_codon:yes gene_type:complete
MNIWPEEVTLEGQWARIEPLEFHHKNDLASVVKKIICTYSGKQ